MEMNFINIVGICLISYIVIWFVFGIVWYCHDWYQWIVNKKKDHKFPITAQNSWQIHFLFSGVWPILIWIMIQGLVKFIKKAFTSWR